MEGINDDKYSEILNKEFLSLYSDPVDLTHIYTLLDEIELVNENIQLGEQVVPQ